MSDALLGLSLLLRALEPLANGVVDLDVVARARLNALAGKRLRLHPLAPFTHNQPSSATASVTLAFAAQRFTLHAGDTSPVDLALTGTPLALLHALRNGRFDDAKFIVTADGDVTLLTNIADLLRELSPDLLAPLRAAVGNDVASALHTGGALAREAAKRMATSASPLLASGVTMLRDIGTQLRRRRSGD